MSTTVAELLAELGGVARFGVLSATVGRETLEAAVASGDVVRDARGVYALPGAEEARGPGSRQVRAVAARASALASGPFESVGRSLCDEVPGLHVEPQVQIGAARADLVDRRLRIVVECDSFAWHGTRGALVSDARRYNEMVVDGWIVIRLTYEDVMHHPARVRAVLAEAVALAELLAQRLPDGPRAA